MSKLRVLDLFSGIGGFSLGLERTGGFETVAFCEIEPYPRAVLAKHWPGVPCYEDVQELTAGRLAADGIAIDVICGGFPCQDLSFAGKRAGLEGDRSGLWSEYARLIGEIRPRFVIVENVSGLLSLGMGDVLGSLAALGYDATWDCVPASAVGAPHRRDRVWIIAYSNGKHGRAGAGRQNWEEVGNGCKIVADTNGNEQYGRLRNVQMGWSGSTSKTPNTSYAGGNEWSFEPAVGRVAHGVPHRVDRLRALGNAVVPQIPELIGRAILKAEGLTP